MIQVWFVLFQLSLNVAEFNVLSLFHELAHREKYVPPSVEEKSKENTLNQCGATIRGRTFWLCVCGSHSEVGILSFYTLLAEIDEEEDLLEEETSQKEETATNPLELPYGG